MVPIGNVICYNVNSKIISNHYGYGSYNELITLKKVRGKIKDKYKLSMHVKQLNKLLKQYEMEELEKEKLNKKLNEIETEKEQFEYEIRHLYGGFK